MYNKIYVFSPTAQATGGTELLQQLVFKLRAFGQNAYMVYTTPYVGSKVEEIFGPRYNNPFTDDVEDSKDNIIVVSEAAMYLLLNYKFVQKAVWWLSVDFYGGSFRLPTDSLHKVFYRLSDSIYRQYDKEWIHLVQSEYAYKYCIEEREISSSHVFRLSDYLSKAFIQNADINTDTIRKNQVLYNPKKGYVFTEALINANPDIQWVPIVDMTSNQIVSLMKESKVYIDFGMHPGKDRIPREAALCGCCVLTGKRGAASNNVDIPIPECYKFDESEKERIIKQINNIFINYRDCKKYYESYVAKIKNEEQVFENEIRKVFIETEIANLSKSVAYIIKLKVLRTIVYGMKFIPAKFGHK